MKFGLFVNSQQPRTQDPVLSFRQCVQQVIVARDAGFDAIAAKPLAFPAVTNSETNSVSDIRFNLMLFI